jgi:hypothetical protein
MTAGVKQQNGDCIIEVAMGVREAFPRRSGTGQEGFSPPVSGERCAKGGRPRIARKHEPDDA